MLDFHGAQVTSLNDQQLREEGIRMRKVIEAATAALTNVEGQLEFRRRL